ncbi:MAG: hydroxymethylbilane synthase [Acidimicrobiia bacterium]|nr:hydroxymethylbilane synthase [Acidimicrobiia bacterium]MDQ3501182.1 hydroxymethylbilane synthase [Actinomycetota bacterium]
MTEVRIATRRSALALVQAVRVGDLLCAVHPGLSVRLVEVASSGDLDRKASISELTEVGAFVRSLQEAVIDGRADLAVHSMKDLPVAGPEELVLASVPERGSPFDVLVGSSLDELPWAGLVGTGSPRRVEQLLELRPDLRTIELRGNVDTRLRKVADGEVDGAVLAEAGLDRLGRAEMIAHRFDLAQMVPAPGQGALAVEARAGSNFAELAAAIDDNSIRILLETERLLLAETGAGCRSALGAYATWHEETIRLDAFVADEQGRRRAVVFGETPEAVVAVARKELRL